MSIKVDTIPEAHQILMEQLPEWFKPVLEYIAIMQAYAGEFSDIEQKAARIEANFFIQTADDATLRYWEKLLGIPTRLGDPLDFRRQRILMKLNQRAPFTIWDLRDRLTELFGDDYTMSLDVPNCKLSISVTSERYGAIDLLYDVINEIAPVHLAVKANQQVTNFIASDHYIGALTTRTFEQTIGG